MFKTAFQNNQIQSESSAANQEHSMMYHDMVYPSHNYTNYLNPYVGEMMDTNAYESVRLKNHLSSISATPSQSHSLPTILQNSQPTYDSMHNNHHNQHQHMAMMHTQHDNRSWYQPPISAIPQQTDHR